MDFADLVDTRLADSLGDGAVRARDASVDGRPTTRQRSALPTLLLADTVALAAASLLTDEVLGVFGHRPWLTASLTALAWIPVVLLVFGCYGLYRRAGRRLIASAFPDLSHLAHALVVSCILVLLLGGPVHRLVGLQSMSRAHIVIAAVIGAVAVPATRLAVRWLMRPRGRATSRVLIVGSGVVAGHVIQRLQQVSGRQIVGYVDDNHPDAAVVGAATVPQLGGLADLAEVVARHDVDLVVVAFSTATGARLASALRSLANNVQISVVPRLFDLLTVRSHVDDLHGLPVVDVAPAALGPAERVLKRAVDIACSGVALITLSPVLATIAVLVKITSPGPVLFRQQRTGRGGIPFMICKFRSMRAGADRERDGLASSNQVDGPIFKLREDARVTRLGRVLRTASLDELPQLFNVLLGDMSLVGPRPFISSESAGIEGWAARRFDVRPGITGLWQTCGRSDLPFDELCRLDYSYVASWSFWWDLRIMWHTPAAVLRRRGAY